MSNNKQSSIEWLVEKLGKYNEEMVFLYQNEIEQAKAMHKVEIVNAVDGFPIHTRHMDGEEYYEEIFEGEK